MKSQKATQGDHVAIAARLGLTRAEWDILEHAAGCERHGWKFGTGRTIKRRDVLGLVKRKLVADVGLVVQVDGDGFTIKPERYRQGYELTDAGRALRRRMVAALGGGVFDANIWLLPTGQVEHWNGESFVAGWGPFDASALAGPDAERYAAWKREHDAAEASAA